MISAPTRLALKVGLATALAIFVAFFYHLQDGYWVGISAFLICAERVGNSLDKMIQRIVCTLLGAASGLLVTHFFMESPLLLILVSFVFVTFTVYKGFKNDDWYIWIFTAITFFMVVATAMTGAAPIDILDVAFYRSLDIIVGSVIGFLVNVLVFPVHAGALLEAKLPVFLKEFELYYALAIESLFLKKKPPDLPSLRQKMNAELITLSGMKTAAEKESIFFERKRRFLLEHTERVSVAIKEFIAFEAHLQNEDSRYVQHYREDILALHDYFKRFLHEPLFYDQKVEAALATLHQHYDEKRRQGLNFQYPPEAVTVFHEIVGLHQLLFDLIKFSFQQNLKSYHVPIKNRSAYIRSNRYYWIFGMKVGIGILLCPLIWIEFALPGAMQIAVSMGAVLNLDFNATKQKSLMRVYGCFVGAALAMLTLMVLRVESLTILLLLIFGVAYYCSYLHNSSSRYAYLGTQAIVAYLMGVIVAFSPSLIPDPAVERLVDITAGVLFLYFILEWLWPFSRKELSQHYQAQMDEHFVNLIDMTQAYLPKADFDLMASMQKPIRILKRDAAQAAKLGLKVPHYIALMDQVEAFLVFIAMHGSKLKSYESWILQILAAAHQGGSQALLEKLDKLLHSMRKQTLKGDFTPLETIMTVGTLLRMARVLAC